MTRRPTRLRLRRRLLIYSAPLTVVAVLVAVKLVSVVVVDVEVVKDDAGQAAFEAAQCFRVRGARVESFAVVGAAEAIEADLGHSDAVQGGVELTIA